MLVVECEQISMASCFLPGDYQAMITLTGFDLPSFHYLANLFAPIYEQYTPYMDTDGLIIRKVSLARE